MELWLAVLLTKSNLLSHLFQFLAVQLNDAFFLFRTNYLARCFIEESCKFVCKCIVTSPVKSFSLKSVFYSNIPTVLWICIFFNFDLFLVYHRSSISDGFLLFARERSCSQSHPSCPSYLQCCKTMVGTVD